MQYGHRPWLWAALLGVFLLGGSTGAAAQNQKNLDIWFERGMTAYEEARYDDALEAFTWIVKRDRKRTEAYYMMAKTHRAAGDLKDADKAIVQALRWQPENVKYLVMQLQLGFPRDRIKALRKQKKHDLVQKIMDLDPDNAEANLAFGIEATRLYLYNRNRITIPTMRSYETPFKQRVGNPKGGAMSEDLASIREGADPGVEKPHQRNPFDLDRQKAAGEGILEIDDQAQEAYPRAIDHLTRALRADPSLREAYTNLAALYVDRPDAQALWSMAQDMRALFPQDPYTWLYLGYAAYALNRMEEAQAHFMIAYNLMPPEMKTIFEDVSRLFNKEQEKMAETSGVNAAAFWQRRDPRLLTPYNERRLEHYARLVYAGLLFGEPKIDLAGWDSDRGRIYVRYGPPEKDFYMSNMVADCRSGKWVHTNSTSISNIHVFDYGEYQFVFGNNSGVGNISEGEQFGNTSIPSLNEFPLYSPCASVLVHPDLIAREAAFDYVIQAAETIRQQPERFDFDPPGDRVEMPFLVSRFKGAAGQADLVIPYAVPVSFIPPGGVLSVDLQTAAFAVAEEGAVEEVRRHLTALEDVQMLEFGPATLWVDVHRLAVAPGRYDLSVEMQTRTAVGFHHEVVAVPDYNAGLQLSDLLLAYAIEEGAAGAGAVARGGLSIIPAPWSAYRVGQPLYFYFEFYNLKQQPDGATQYAVEAVLVERREEKGLQRLIQRAFRGREQVGVAAGFEANGASADDRQYLVLDTGDLEPGVYVLAVRLTDTATGQTAETQRAIVLE